MALWEGVIGERALVVTEVEKAPAGHLQAVGDFAQVQCTRAAEGG